MTNEAQIKALAELDGWTLAIQKGNVFGVAFRMRDAFNKPIWEDELPPYLTSYDAIIPLIQKQDLIIGKHFMQVLHKFVPGSGDHHVKDFYLFLCSPAQLCKALLRATGKWTE